MAKGWRGADDRGMDSIELRARQSVAEIRALIVTLESRPEPWARDAAAWLAWMLEGIK